MTRLTCAHCPARFSTEWEREVHEKEHQDRGQECGYAWPHELPHCQLPKGHSGNHKWKAGIPNPATASSELVERLRQNARCNCCGASNDRSKAADEIERLTAELERMKTKCSPDRDSSTP